MTRFNKQELINLACQPSHKFDKEGLLVVYERQDSLFKRTENKKEIKEKSRKTRRSNTFKSLSCYGGFARVPCERWCRLRGNLLFYFKSREAWSEPAGVIVLNINNINKDPVAIDGLYGFNLVMMNGGGDQRLAALSEGERDSWSQVLEKMSLAHNQQKITELLEKLKLFEAANENFSNISTPGELPLAEISVSCDNLRCDGHGHPPSPRAVLEAKIFPSQNFVSVGQTEVVKGNGNPSFLTTIPIWHSTAMTSDMTLRLAVYDVIEHVTRTTALIGCTELVFSSLMEENSKLRLQLFSADKITVVGFATLSRINAGLVQMQNRNSSNPQSPQSVEEVFIQGHRRTQSLPPRIMNELQPLPQGWISAFFVNPVTKTFRFHSGLGGDIVVYESMLESRLNHVIPSQLLRLWINEEKDLVRELAALGELNSSSWQHKMLQLLERHFRRIGDYTQALESVESSSSFFRPSSCKDKATLQFSPVNLHLQRMWVQNSSLRKSALYDCITVGAFTAIPHGFKGGGLLRLLKNFQNNNAHSVDAVRVARQAAQAAAKTVQHLQAAVKLLLSATETKNPAALLKAAEAVVKKCQTLVGLLEPLNVMEALEFFDEFRKVNQQNASVSSTVSDASLQPLRSMAQRVTNDCSLVQNAGFYSAADEPEPPDLTKINMEASLMALASKLKVFIKQCSSSKPCFAQPGVYLTALLVQLEEKESESQSQVIQLCSKDDVDLPSKPSILSAPSAVTKPDYEAEPLVSELKPCLSKLLRAAHGLLKTIRLVHGVQRLREEPLRAATSHALQHRRDVCFSQSLTAAITALVARLCCQSPDPEFLLLLSRIGVLFGVEGLLSPFKAEAGMWSDLAVAVEDLATVKFRIVPANNSDQQDFLTAGIPPSFMPHVQGWREEIQVTIPVPAAVFSALPPEAARPGCVEFQLTPVLFNVAINEQAILAEKFGDMTAVMATNQQSCDRLQNYARKFQKLLSEKASAKKSGEFRVPLTVILEKLETEVVASKIQNVDILHLAETAVRRMKGLRMTSCKSAKDRTGMAVTLEETLILQEEFDLASSELQRVLDALRSEGTRHKNTEKNVGAAKYAFTQLQLMSFPSMYKPPAGTYGNVQS